MPAKHQGIALHQPTKRNFKTCALGLFRGHALSWVMVKVMVKVRVKVIAARTAAKAFARMAL
jgi:hypothetical protein